MRRRTRPLIGRLPTTGFDTRFTSGIHPARRPRVARVYLAAPAREAGCPGGGDPDRVRLRPRRFVGRCGGAWVAREREPGQAGPCGPRPPPSSTGVRRGRGVIRFGSVPSCVRTERNGTGGLVVLACWARGAVRVRTERAERSVRRVPVRLANLRCDRTDACGVAETIRLLRWKMTAGAQVYVRTCPKKSVRAYILIRSSTTFSISDLTACLEI
jgi:hypothetical protein